MPATYQLRTFLVVCSLFLASLASAALDITKPYPSGMWRRDYTQLVKDRLKIDRHQALVNINPGMVQELCPRYDRLKRADRENFWVSFFMSVAYAESDFNNNSGPKSGMMQLTCDANARIGYGCSLCTSNQRLKNSPLIGLDCAMNIISHWAKRGRLVGQHPYFETLRKNTHFNRKVKPTIITYAPKECAANFKPTPWHWILKTSKIEHLWPYGQRNLE